MLIIKTINIDKGFIGGVYIKEVSNPLGIELRD